MLFSSLTFLFAFLPILIILYYVIPNRTFRNVILLIFSLGFYAWGEPIYILLMIFSIVFNYFMALLIDKNTNGLKKLIFIFSLLVNIGLLAYFKYMDFFITNINNIFSINLPLMNIALPIGISFYTFQIMSYIIDVYRGDVKVQKNIIIVGTYVSLFCQLIAGPVVRYQTVEDELQNRKENFDDFSNGLRRFIIGLGKKVIIANNVGLIANAAFNATNNELGVSFAWVGAIAYTLQIYYDFSGYSDMAIGLGRMFGFHFLENFNYPYTALSITDFWRRWHISMSSWFRDYVYIPLGGNRVPKWRWFLNIFIVWFLTGMWHGAEWNFIVWGLYYGLILVIEKIFMGKLLDKLPKIIRFIYSIFLIIIGWVIFNCTSFTQIANYLGAMFGNNGFNSIKVFYNLSIAHLWPYMLLGIIGSTPLIKKIYDKMNTKVSTGIIYDVFLLGVLFLCVMYLVNSSFNPFIYFRF